MQHVRLATVDTSTVVDSATQLQRYKHSFSRQHVFLPGPSALRVTDACGESFQIGDPLQQCKAGRSSQRLLDQQTMRYCLEQDVLVDAGSEHQALELEPLCSCGSIFECIVDQFGIHRPFIVVETQSIADEAGVRKQIRQQTEPVADYLTRMTEVMSYVYPQHRKPARKGGSRGRSRLHKGDLEAEREVSVVDISEEDMGLLSAIEKRIVESEPIIDLILKEVDNQNHSISATKRLSSSGIASALDQITAEIDIAFSLEFRVSLSLSRLRQRMTVWKVLGEGGLFHVEEKALAQMRGDIASMIRLDQTVADIKARRLATVNVSDLARKEMRRRSASAQARVLRSLLKPFGVDSVSELPLLFLSEKGTIQEGDYTAFPVSLSHLRELDVILPPSIPLPISVLEVVKYITPPPKKALFMVVSDSTQVSFGTQMQVLSAHFPLLPAVKNELVSLHQVPRKNKIGSSYTEAQRLIERFKLHSARCKAMVDAGADSVSSKRMIQAVMKLTNAHDVQLLLSTISLEHFAACIDSATRIFAGNDLKLSISRNSEVEACGGQHAADIAPCLLPLVAYLSRSQRASTSQIELTCAPMTKYMNKSASMKHVSIIIGQPGTGRVHGVTSICEALGLRLVRVSALDVSRLAKQQEVYSGPGLNSVLSGLVARGDVLLIEQAHQLRGRELQEVTNTEATVILMSPTMTELRAVPFCSQIIPQVELICNMAVPSPAERVTVLKAMGEAIDSQYSAQMHGATTSDLYQVFRASRMTGALADPAQRLVFTDNRASSTVTAWNDEFNEPSVHYAPGPLFLDPWAWGELLQFFGSEPIQRPVFGFATKQVQSSTGLLLCGVSGQGKSEIAKALALHSGMSVLRMGPTTLLKAAVGEAEKALRSVFVQARRLAPAIVLVDDIQAVFHADISDIEGGESLLAQFAAILDQAYLLREIPSKQVIFVCSAEHHSLVHPLLLRKGRIDTHIPLSQLGRAERRALQRCRGVLSSLSLTEQKTLVKYSEGCTVGELLSLQPGASLLTQLSALVEIKLRWSEEE